MSKLDLDDSDLVNPDWCNFEYLRSNGGESYYIFTLAWLGETPNPENPQFDNVKIYNVVTQNIDADHVNIQIIDKKFRRFNLLVHKHNFPHIESILNEETDLTADERKEMRYNLLLSDVKMSIIAYLGRCDNAWANFLLLNHYEWQDEIKRKRAKSLAKAELSKLGTIH